MVGSHWQRSNDAIYTTNSTQFIMPSEVAGGCANHRTETLIDPNFWEVAYRGLNSFLLSLGIALSWREFSVRVATSDPVLDLRHLWRPIQFQSSLWDSLRPLLQLLHGSTFPSAQSCFPSFYTGDSPPMQKRVSIAAWDCYPSNTCLEVWPLADIWELGFQ